MEDSELPYTMQFWDQLHHSREVGHVLTALHQLQQNHHQLLLEQNQQNRPNPTTNTTNSSNTTTVLHKIALQTFGLVHELCKNPPSVQKGASQISHLRHLNHRELVDLEVVGDNTANARTAQAVLRWLESQHQSPSQIPQHQAQYYWPETQTKNQNAHPNGLHPDTKIPLEQSDKTSEGYMMGLVWKCLLAGDIDLACEVCSNNGQAWLAAILRSRDLSTDPIHQNAAPNNGTTNQPLKGQINHTQLLKCLRQLANNAPVSHAKSVYGVLSFDTESSTCMCDTWEDTLWCLVHAAYSNFVYNVIVNQQPASTTLHIPSIFSQFDELQQNPAAKALPKCRHRGHIAHESGNPDLRLSQPPSHVARLVYRVLVEINVERNKCALLFQWLAACVEMERSQVSSDDATLFRFQSLFVTLLLTYDVLIKGKSLLRDHQRIVAAFGRSVTHSALVSTVVNEFNNQGSTLHTETVFDIGFADTVESTCVLRGCALADLITLLPFESSFQIDISMPLLAQGNQHRSGDLVPWKLALLCDYMLEFEADSIESASQRQGINVQEVLKQFIQRACQRLHAQQQAHNSDFEAEDVLMGTDVTLATEAQQLFRVVLRKIRLLNSFNRLPWESLELCVLALDSPSEKVRYLNSLARAFALHNLLPVVEEQQQVRLGTTVFENSLTAQKSQIPPLKFEELNRFGRLVQTAWQDFAEEMEDDVTDHLSSKEINCWGIFVQCLADLQNGEKSPNELIASIRNVLEHENGWLLMNEYEDGRQQATTGDIDDTTRAILEGYAPQILRPLRAKCLPALVSVLLHLQDEIDPEASLEVGNLVAHEEFGVYLAFSSKEMRDLLHEIALRYVPLLPEGVVGRAS